MLPLFFFVAKEFVIFKQAWGLVHKLRLQEEGVGSPKLLIFVNVHKVENVNVGD